MSVGASSEAHKVSTRADDAHVVMDEIQALIDQWDWRHAKNKRRQNAGLPAGAPAAMVLEFTPRTSGRRS